MKNFLLLFYLFVTTGFKSGSRNPVISNKKLFATLVDGFQSLAIIAKGSILHFTEFLDQLQFFFIAFNLYTFNTCEKNYECLH